MTELLLSCDDGYQYKRIEREWNLVEPLVEWHVHAGEANGFVQITDAWRILELEQDFQMEDNLLL